MSTSLQHQGYSGRQGQEGHLLSLLEALNNHHSGTDFENGVKFSTKRNRHRLWWQNWSMAERQEKRGINKHMFFEGMLSKDKTVRFWERSNPASLIQGRDQHNFSVTYDINQTAATLQSLPVVTVMLIQDACCSQREVNKPILNRMHMLLTQS